MKPPLLIALLLAPLSGLLADDRPNVVVVMADDLGYGDLSCYGAEHVRTPTLDKMAKQGVRLTDFYAGCTVCTPSRMALLTGSYPVRLGWRGGVGGYKIPPRNGLNPKAVTMAEVFQAAGYRTGMTGKWHLGEALPLLPTNQGFDDCFYITKSNNQTKKLYRGDELIEDPYDNRRITERFFAEAEKFVEANRERPFFLYVPLTAPHFPAQAHPDWKGRTKSEYGDVVEELDARMGSLLDTIDELGLGEKTVVVFLSDNGTEPSQRQWGRSKPYRGLKWSTLEGGNRVPCIVRCPGTIPGGRVSNELTAAVDLLPTLAHACGIELGESKFTQKLDGIDVWNTLVTGKAEHARGDLLYWHGWATPQAIRVGDWKLYFDEVKEIPETKAGPVLVNLADDPAEKTNLAEQHPDRVQSMLTRARTRLADVATHQLPLGGPEWKPQPPKPAKWLD